MKKELLSEINRFREIVGLSLIKESIIPSSLLSNLETMLSPGGRNIEDFFRTGSGKVIDDVYEFVKKMLLTEFPNIFISRAEVIEGPAVDKKDSKMRKRKIMVSTQYFSALKSIEC